MLKMFTYVVRSSRQQAGPVQRGARLGDRGVPAAAHHQGQDLAGPGLQRHHGGGGAGRGLD